MDPDFWLFFVVGVVAQLIDGSLGMGYGVISSSTLLALGVPPVHASAAVHGAKLFTNSTSGISHALHGNVDWRMFFPLALAGCVGAVLGAFVLTGIDGDTIRPWITAYLAIMGLLILFKARQPAPQPRAVRLEAAPIGLVGGACDALGGGGWGPVVTPALVARGGEPRKVVGTVSLAEFCVAVAASATFLTALLTGRWQDDDELAGYIWAVAGLAAGGVLAAPFAGWITKIAPERPMRLAVGILVTGIAGFQTLKLIGWF